MSKLDEPLFFAPIPVERVWGGNRLTALFGKSLPTGKVIGESWELADRAEARSTIVGGSHDGRSLNELMKRYPRELLGEALAARKPRRFPLLIKYIDAGQDLSVQVHPDDEGCRRLGIDDRGKTECWVVVHAEPGSRMNRGVAPGVARPDFEKALAAGRVEEALHFFPVKPGDVVAIPPGMVHAIGKGIVLAEIQQNSDVTFRVYDYQRLGLDGKPRALHVSESLETIAFDTPAVGFFQGDMKADLAGNAFASSPANGEKEFLRGRYFDLRVARVEPAAEWHPTVHGRSVTVVMCICGSGSLNGRALSAGQTLLLPAALAPGRVSFRATAGAEMTLLLSSPTAEA